MVRQLFLATIIFCFAAPALSQYVPGKVAGGWQMARDDARESCVALGGTGTGGTSIAFSWTSRNNYWSINLTNENWNLDPNKYYFANVYVDSDFLFKRQLVPATHKLAYLRIWKNKDSRRAIKELSDGRKLIILFESRRIREEFHLQGSAAALDALSSCAGDYGKSNTRKPAPLVSAGEPEFKPANRDKAITALDRIMKAMELSYKVLPNTTNSYRVTFESNQSIGLFYVATNDRRTADEIVGIETSLEQTNCEGDFTSTVKRIPTTDGSILRTLFGYCKTGSGALIATTTVISQLPTIQFSSVLKIMTESKIAEKLEEHTTKGKGLAL